jgi:molecular chaperone HscA
MLVDAQLISDSIDPSAWHDGLDVELANGILRAIKDISDADKMASPFIDRRVTEATAAASGISDHISNQRPRVIVADIGAGTCDFGAYQFVLPRDAQARVAPIAGTERAIKQAGNRLDDFLVSNILIASGTDADSDSGRRISKYVRRDIRLLKQSLFRDGTVRVQVPDYLDITILREDFVRSPHVARFVETFRSTFVETVMAAADNFFESGTKKYVVLTGGGAGLPMIRELFDAPLHTPSGPIYFQRLDPTPTWVGGFGPDVRDLFPQLAVSTGGCSPDLPEERSGVRDTTAAPKRYIQPAMKG